MQMQGQVAKQKGMRIASMKHNHPSSLLRKGLDQYIAAKPAQSLAAQLQLQLHLLRGHCYEKDRYQCLYSKFVKFDLRFETPLHLKYMFQRCISWMYIECPINVGATRNIVRRIRILVFLDEEIEET